MKNNETPAQDKDHWVAVGFRHISSILGAPPIAFRSAVMAASRTRLLPVSGWGCRGGLDKALSSDNFSNAAMLVWKKRIPIFRFEEGCHSR